jgi:hypothetical protein
MNRECRKCKKVKNITDFHKSKKEALGRRFVCKECRKIYSANRFNKKKLNYYIVYYIPSHHYLGITNEPESRMSYHKRTGKDISDFKVLYCCECRKEAKYIEALFHSVLGIEGLSMT